MTRDWRWVGVWQRGYIDGRDYYNLEWEDQSDGFIIGPELRLRNWRRIWQFQRTVGGFNPTDSKQQYQREQWRSTME
jgi:hypothetical protein